MTDRQKDIETATWAAALAAGAMIATHIAAKATRDALFLSNFPVTELPKMLVGSSVLSILMVLAASRVLVPMGPRRVTPIAFTFSAALLLGLWGLIQGSPAAAAIGLYLHVSSFGVILISAFWSLVNERFDPHTAKLKIGRIVGASTFGGLLGGIGAERLAATFDVSVILPVLAGLHLFCAWQTARLGRSVPSETAAGTLDSDAPGEGDPERSGVFATMRRATYLRNLGLLVILGTMAAAVLDYVYKVEATARFARADHLMRFFAVYYVAVGLITFGVQTLISRRVLERLGLVRSAAFLPGAAAAGGAAVLLVPGLISAVVARFSEAVIRSSLFRSAYELFFIPVSARDKRATKTLIDVGFDKLGDTLGGGMIALVLILVPVALGNRVLLGAAVVLSLLALWTVFRLQKGYVSALEESLQNHIIDPASPELEDGLTRTVVMKTLSHLAPGRRQKTMDLLRPTGTTPKDPRVAGRVPPRTSRTRPALDDALVNRILELRSGDRDRIHAALSSPGELDPALTPHIIPLIARADVKQQVIEALQRLAPRVSGQILDGLLDPQEEFIIRRRLPQVLARCETPRVATGLLVALGDKRFEVRYKSGIALARILQRRPELTVNRDRVFEAILDELKVDPYVWKDRRLLDEPDDSFASIFGEDLLRSRIQRSLEHVFTLLSLALDRKTLTVAYRGLHTDDQMLRGTALEYLEVILPGRILEALQPWLGEVRAREDLNRNREQVEAELLKSSASIDLHLEGLLAARGRKPT